MNKSAGAKNRKQGLIMWLVLPCLFIAGCSTAPEPSPSSSTVQESTSNVPTPQPSNSPSASASETEQPSTEPTQEPSAAQKILATLSMKEKIGQILMAGIPATGSSAQDRELITENALGNIFLKGRSSLGVEATREIVGRAENAVADGQSTAVAPWVATDQEGGLVQVLKGAGFSQIPSGKIQGTWGSQKLEQNASVWAQELSDAGINVNLAPVADTVPSASFAPSNAPIGYFGREFGFTPQAVADSVGAFSQGMKSAGVGPVVKHFPGLGRVTKNTDVAKNVTDTQTTRNDPYLEPFRSAIAEKNQWVMVSNAYYSKIDPENIAPFSSTIMRGMLRDDLGFDGMIISDDVCEAAQLTPWSLATRATRFFEAGGTVLLCVDSSKTAVMAEALRTKSTQDPEFATLIDTAALKVLENKLKSGL